MHSRKAVKYYEEGRALQQQGKLTAAERAYKKAIKFNRDFVEAYNNLGNVLLDRSRYREATEAYRKALKILPDHPMLLNNLGNVCHLQGDNKSAIKYCNKAIAQEPNYPDAHINLGNAMRDNGSHEDAVECYRKAIQIDSGNVDAHTNLGILLTQLDRPTEAVVHLEKAVAIDGTYPKACHGLGKVMNLLGKPDRALTLFNKVLEMDPEHAEAILGLGTAMNHLGKPDEAITLFNKVLEIHPESASVWLGLGIAYEALDQWDKAKQSYKRAIELEPDFAEAYLALSDIERFTPDDEVLASMLSQSSNPDTPLKNQVLLNFALGKAFADFEDYGQAFEHIQRGNQLKWQSLQYDMASEIDHFERLKSAFPSDVFSGFETTNSAGITPVFILGLPRSGKTLAESVLAVHSKVHPAGECNYLRRTLSGIAELQNPETIVERLLNTSSDEIEWIANHYIERVKAFAEGMPYVTDTMPENYLYIGYIKILFPGAKIIHCYRHPMDACWLIYRKHFVNKRYEFSFDLDTIATYYERYMDLMAHWQAVLPGFIYNLEYESLVTDTTAEMSRLFSFVGLDWDGTCLDQYENNPLHDNEIGCWQNYREHLGALKQFQNQGSTTKNR